MKNLADIQSELQKFATAHGKENFANIVRVTAHYKNYIDELMLEMVDAGLIDDGLAGYLRTTRPH